MYRGIYQVYQVATLKSVSKLSSLNIEHLFNKVI